MLFESFGATIPCSCTRIEICPRYIYELKRLRMIDSLYLIPRVTRPLDFPHRRDNLSKQEKNRRAF